jgi:hypothetical protein
MFFDSVAMDLRPSKVMKKRLGPATTLYRTVALSFVIPKPRDLRFRGPFLEMFFDRVAMDLRPSKVMKKRLGPATTLYRTVALSFVIPSAAEGSAVRLHPKRRPHKCSQTGLVFR